MAKVCETINQDDVPSPIDLRRMSDALEWEQKAMLRPYRQDFFQSFINELRQINLPLIRVLELGSGPGFLAHYILSNLFNVEMTLLDFSPAMHQLARQRLIDHIHRVKFVEQNFKEADWYHDLGKFDAVITLQAVHELRHKRHATALHQQVRSLLSDNGIYLVCDHFYGEGGMDNDQLFMTLEEQRESLELAGYEVEEILVKGGRALYRASVKSLVDAV